MAGMGRKRKDGNPLGLEPRVEFHHGQFRYLHRDGRKESLGKDIGKANARARVYNDPDGNFGTNSHFLRLFLADARAGRLPAGRKLSERTIADYEAEANIFALSPLGKMTPADLVRDPSLISDYRDRRITESGKGKVQANHALAMLSSMFSWLIERGHSPGLAVNPVKLIRRFARKPKDRYVEDSEYRPVYGVAPRSVCMALRLAYKTLQRPADLLRLTPSPVRLKAVAGTEKRVLTFQQGKRGRIVDIEVDAELDEILGMLRNSDERVVRLPQALIHGRGGKGYTEDGLGSMLRRYCTAAGVKTFGLMDVRAKGATDMYLAGVPLEKIQLLMAHKSVQTTEIYIKRLLATISTVAPNAVAVGN
jgi:integrase